MTVAVDIPDTDSATRLTVWRSRAKKVGLPDNLESFASQYPFTVGRILKACDAARSHAARNGMERIDDATLHIACKEQLAHSLGELAVRMDAVFSWDELILPVEQKRLLRHICDRAAHSDMVYCGWGFERRAARGRGVRALLTGQPGTGKTMAAQVIAGELKRELYKVNLSSMVSKYIGETEKNLDRVFTEASKSGGVLFFDEADAIFGKRSEQKDSHDRYANMQTAFLLERFEDYGGIVLLSTNLVSNLDPAFMRRIHVRVDFPAPDAASRRMIWEIALGTGCVLMEDADLNFLAENFELTGSEIKNIALTAAFFAAASGEKIGMSELVRALKMEYSKIDKILSNSELGEYTDMPL